MKGESALTGQSAGSPRAADAFISHKAWRARAAQELHAACVIAARHEPSERETTYTTTEYEAVRRAVATFVVNCKADDLTPEQALVQLKEAVNDSLRTVGREPHEETLRTIIFDAFLRSYFDYAPSLSGDGRTPSRND